MLSEFVLELFNPSVAEEFVDEESGYDEICDENQNQKKQERDRPKRVKIRQITSASGLT